MEISKNINGDSMILALRGRLDTNSAPQLQDVIQQEQAGIQRLELDFAQLEYISSTGLRVLLSTQKAMPGRMVIRNVCDDVMEVFDITGFTDILTIE